MSSKRGEDRRATTAPDSPFLNGHGQRGASTPARIAAVAAVLVAFVIVIVLLFGGGGGYKYTLLFQTGGQLVPGNEVLTAGQRVGMVDTIDLTDDNQAAVEVTMDEPLREGTTALIRQTSLSGVANRYISLTPGPNNSPEIEQKSTITGEDTTTPVDIDQLFNIFRPRERAALQKFIQGNATVYAGKGELANRAYKFLNPSLSTSEQLFQELTADSVSLSRFLVSGSQTFGALADRREDLTSLIATANELRIPPTMKTIRKATTRLPRTGQPKPRTSSRERPKDSIAGRFSITITGAITAQIVSRKRPGTISSARPARIPSAARIPAPSRGPRKGVACPTSSPIE